MTWEEVSKLVGDKPFVLLGAVEAEYLIVVDQKYGPMLFNLDYQMGTAIRDMTPFDSIYKLVDWFEEEWTIETLKAVVGGSPFLARTGLRTQESELIIHNESVYEISTYGIGLVPFGYFNRYCKLLDWFEQPNSASINSTQNYTKCTCDFYEQLMKYGCNCGGR